MNVLPARVRPLPPSKSARLVRAPAYYTRHVRFYTPPVIAGISEDEIHSARAYCSNLLRKFDQPSHILSTFIPGPARDAYLALRAFNIDLAHIADATTNPQVGAMRMQFWRDGVNSALSYRPPKEPVAVLLSAANALLAAQTDGRSRLSKNWLHRVIAEREKYLHSPPYPDLAALELYSENTYSTLLYLTLQALPLASVTADHLASHVGKAQGIVAVLRGLPLLAFPGPAKHHSNQGAMGGDQKQGVVTLPLDVMARCGLREHEVLRKGANAAGLRDAVFEVATRANDHLITAREMLKNLRQGRDAGHEFEHRDDMEHGDQSEAEGGKSVRGQASEAEKAVGVLMPAIATQEWLDRLQKTDFDVFDAKLRRTDWKLPLRAYWAYSRRQI